jgi:hypothetical protein
MISRLKLVRSIRWSRGCKWHTRLLSGIWLSAAAVVPGANAIAAPYTLVLETRADAPGGQELFVETFPTLTDFLNGVHTNFGGFSVLDVAPAFQLAGFTYNGSDYVAVLETRQDAPGGQELFVETFPTLTDFLNGVHTNFGGFSVLDVDPAFQVAGFATEIAPTVAAPEPNTAAILLLPLLLGAVCRNSNSVKQNIRRDITGSST